MYQKVKDGVYWHAGMGRIVVHRGKSVRIFWNRDMLDYLRRHFPTTLNEELAGCLGVSQRTMIRKARELGLQKEPCWLSDMKRDIELLLTCDYIYMMRRWTHSKGCKVEFDVATAIGLPVLFEETSELIEFE